MPPPRGTDNPLEGPGDYTVTEVVHNDTYDAISPSKQNLSGRAVFIAGGSKGIGLATAISYARAGTSSIALGARSNLSSAVAEVRKAATDAGRKEPKVLEVSLDVTSQESVDAAAKTAEAEFGRLDVLINNAGIISMASVVDSDPVDWWRIMDVNLRGPYLVARAFLPLLLKTEDGLKNVLTVSSVGAHVVLPTASAYQVSKLAVLRLTEFLAAEHSPQGLTAITIHPGNIPTDIVGGAAGVAALPEALRGVFTETVELPADTVLWLTSERRNWLSGRYVNVTWDMPQLEGKREEVVKGDRLKVKLDVDF